jgi:hypothetical protein
MHQESENPSEKFELVAWIEERGAKVGNMVELKGESGLWYVDVVGASVEDKELKKKQTMDRRSLVSITGLQ